MSKATELHNLLSGRFVRDVIGPAVKAGATYSELMVLFESCTLAMLEILARHYDYSPASSTILVETAQQAAIERFAGERKDAG